MAMSVPVTPTGLKELLLVAPKVWLSQKHHEKKSFQGENYLHLASECNCGATL